MTKGEGRRILWGNEEFFEASWEELAQTVKRLMTVSYGRHMTFQRMWSK